MTGLFQSWLRRLVHTADAHRDRMWGVVARIAAAAVVVAAVQHHASQIYEAWRSEQQEGHEQETKFFPKRPDDVAEEGGDGVDGSDDTRTRKDRAGADHANGGERGGSGLSGGHRMYSTFAFRASSASAASLGQVHHHHHGTLVPRAFSFASFATPSGAAAPAPNPTDGLADARAVVRGLRAARRVAR